MVLLIRLSLAAILAAVLPLCVLAREAPAPEAQLRWIYLHRRPAAGATATAPALSERALRRRARLGCDMTESDLPVWQPWLVRLLRIGVRPRVVSRWFHAVSAPLDEDLAARVAALEFVDRIVPVQRLVAGPPRPLPASGPPPCTGDVCPWEGEQQERAGVLVDGLPSEYGESFAQSAMLGIPDLHARGLSGAGILIAILDSGYHKDHFALAGLELRFERDFVDGDGQTQNWVGGVDSTADFHGTATLSVLAGRETGRLVGPAYGAAIALARIERFVGEHAVEEDHLVAALEWADSIGADLVTASVGYRDFPDDDPPGGYAPQDLDGQTALSTRAVNQAARNGMLVVAAVGNFGPAERSLTVPADSDSALAVGAVDGLGRLMSFSSRGPTADGRIKPDLVALGSRTVSGTWQPVPGAAIGYADGTSLATPLIAGLCALLLEADSTRAPLTIMEDLRASGSLSATPDCPGGMGFGLPWGPRALATGEATLVPDALRWSPPARLGEESDLEVRLTNRGAEPSNAALIAVYSLARGVSATGGSLQLAPVPPGDSCWVGPWRVRLTGLGGEGGGSWITFSLEDAGRRRYRWVSFPVLPARRIVPVALGLAGAHPCTGSRPLELTYRHPFGGVADLEVYDVEGRLRVRLGSRIPIDRGTGRLSFGAELVAGLPAGRYLIRMRTATGSAGLSLLCVRR